MLPAVTGLGGLLPLLAVAQVFEPSDDASKCGVGLVTIDAGAADLFVERVLGGWYIAG